MGTTPSGGATVAESFSVSGDFPDPGVWLAGCVTEAHDQRPPTAIRLFDDQRTRLTRDVCNGRYTALDFTADYLFDLASNRLEKTVDKAHDGTVDEKITYAYDQNDRLLTEEIDSDNDGTVDQTTTYT